jgi:multiple sugar transport system substrate-binding protein
MPKQTSSAGNFDHSATPLYPLISSSFERALQEVREGADSAQALDRAVEAIEAATRRQQRRGGA